MVWSIVYFRPFWWTYNYQFYTVKNAGSLIIVCGSGSVFHAIICLSDNVIVSWHETFKQLHDTQWILLVIYNRHISSSSIWRRSSWWETCRYVSYDFWSGILCTTCSINSDRNDLIMSVDFSDCLFMCFLVVKWLSKFFWDLKIEWTIFPSMFDVQIVHTNSWVRICDPSKFLASIFSSFLMANKIKIILGENISLKILIIMNRI